MWSMGVVSYVLISGYFPFMAGDKRQVVRNILQMKITLQSPKIFESISQPAKDLILSMLNRNPLLRLTA